MNNVNRMTQPNYNYMFVPTAKKIILYRLRLLLLAVIALLSSPLNSILQSSAFSFSAYNRRTTPSHHDNLMITRKYYCSDWNHIENLKFKRRNRYSLHLLKLSTLPQDLAYDAINEGWEHNPALLSRPYVSKLVKDMDDDELNAFLSSIQIDYPNYDTAAADDNYNELNDSTKVATPSIRTTVIDPLWEQIKLEAKTTIESEPESGPQLYTLILSQPSLLYALISILSHEISTELIPATLLLNLFLEMLDPIQDTKTIELDVMAAAMRSPSVVDGSALTALLFHQGLHALTCHRLSYRLWKAGRTGLAYYVQSTVSRRYSVDIHPAATISGGIYLNAGSAGVVIGETAVVGQDVTILQGVTLGGTGKEKGDRHPKIKRGVILQHGCSVLGNIVIGAGAVITAKSIVTKPIPPYARVSGVPAKIKSYRELDVEKDGNLLDSDCVFFVDDDAWSDVEKALGRKYLQIWGEDETCNMW